LVVGLESELAALELGLEQLELAEPLELAAVRAEKLGWITKPVSGRCSQRQLVRMQTPPLA
jgi:hypothetical protein